MNTDAPRSAAGRDRAYKAAVSGLEKRKLTVAASRFGTQPLVDLRILTQQGEGVRISLTLAQARQAIRLLCDAVEAANQSPRHDGNPHASTGREPAAEDLRDVGSDA